MNRRKFFSGLFPALVTAPIAAMAKENNPGFETFIDTNGDTVLKNGDIDLIRVSSDRTVAEFGTFQRAGSSWIGMRVQSPSNQEFATFRAENK